MKVQKHQLGVGTQWMDGHILAPTLLPPLGTNCPARSRLYYLTPSSPQHFILSWLSTKLWEKFLQDKTLPAPQSQNSVF